MYLKLSTYLGKKIVISGSANEIVNIEISGVIKAITSNDSSRKIFKFSFNFDLPNSSIIL